MKGNWLSSYWSSWWCHAALTFNWIHFEKRLGFCKIRTEVIIESRTTTAHLHNHRCLWRDLTSRLFCLSIFTTHIPCLLPLLTFLPADCSSGEKTVIFHPFSSFCRLLFLCYQFHWSPSRSRKRGYWFNCKTARQENSNNTVLDWGSQLRVRIRGRKCNRQQKEEETIITTKKRPRTTWTTDQVTVSI